MIQATPPEECSTFGADLRPLDSQIQEAFDGVTVRLFPLLRRRLDRPPTLKHPEPTRMFLFLGGRLQHDTSPACDQMGTMDTVDPVVIGTVGLFAAVGLIVFTPRTVEPLPRIPHLLSTRAAGCSWVHIFDQPSTGAAARLGMRKLRSDGRGYTLVSLPDGAAWVPDRNADDLEVIASETERDQYYIEKHGVKAGDIVLDCGANIGTFTRRALKAGARLIVAIEPAPENLECLRRNFASEIQAGRVIVYPKGVWDHEDTLTLRTYDQQSGGDSVAVVFPDSHPTKIAVALTTIDTLVSELHLPRVNFIKMDIEGAERQALRGARNTVTRFRPRLAIALEHLPDDAERIPALIRSLWPQMRTECGPCFYLHPPLFGRIQPEVAFAW